MPFSPLPLPRRIPARMSAFKVIGPNMVLQQGIPAPIWGWADAGEEVSVKFADQEKKVSAGQDGSWMVKLDALEASAEPRDLVIAGKNTMTLGNVLVGEVWVCSGQSNMEWSVGGSDNGQQEIAAANFPKIRLFHIPKTTAGRPQPDVNADWKECSPQTVGGFSAVGYFMGRKLHQELDVPVGLINTSWGGTRIEPWCTLASFEANPALADIAKRVKQTLPETPEGKETYAGALAQIEAWLPQARAALDEGKPLPNMPGLPRELTGNQDPCALYNAMVHGIVPFGIRGAIWYQGESNMGEGMLYYEKSKALVDGWRKAWGQGEFPFQITQIAPFQNYGDGALPAFWEAQDRVVQDVPNTGIAGTGDISNLADIHPRNKQDVGLRHALWALANTYGKKDIVWRGPRIKDAKLGGATAEVSFDHAGTGLSTRDGKAPDWFQVAGEDKNFVDAKAEITGDNTVAVSAEGIGKIAAVRFGWKKTAEPNLQNKEGLPAYPFRTDSW
ncbi:MAG: sialate O-acetylesterase [Verrucomicrobiales bacterium]